MQFSESFRTLYQPKQEYAPTLMEQFETIEMHKRRSKVLMRKQDVPGSLQDIAKRASEVERSKSSQKDMNFSLDKSPIRKMGSLQSVRKAVQLSPVHGSGCMTERHTAATRSHKSPDARNGLATQRETGFSEKTKIKKDATWEGKGLEAVWKGEKERPIQAIWPQVINNVHYKQYQERVNEEKRLLPLIQSKANEIITIADLDLSRSAVQAKLHRDKDPLKRGTAALLKLSPHIIKGIRNNVIKREDDKDREEARNDKIYRMHLTASATAEEGHAESSEEAEAPEASLRAARDTHESPSAHKIDIDSFVTPRRNYKVWERDLVGLIEDKQKRKVIVETKKADKQRNNFHPPAMPPDNQQHHHHHRHHGAKKSNHRHRRTAEQANHDNQSTHKKGHDHQSMHRKDHDHPTLQEEGHDHQSVHRTGHDHKDGILLPQHGEGKQESPARVPSGGRQSAAHDDVSSADDDDDDDDDEYDYGDSDDDDREAAASQQRVGAHVRVSAPVDEMYEDDEDLSDDERERRRRLGASSPSTSKQGKMGWHFRNTAWAIHKMNRAMESNMVHYDFRVLRLEGMMNGSKKGSVVEQVQHWPGLLDSKAKQCLNDMKTCLDKSAKSIHEVRRMQDKTSLEIPEKVLRHPPYAPDLIAANKTTVVERSLRKRFPAMLHQCIERTEKDIDIVRKKANLEMQRLEAVEASLLRRDARIIENAIQVQIVATRKFSKRWLISLVLAKTVRVWMSKIFAVLLHRKVVRPAAACKIQSVWRDWHKRRIAKSMGVVRFIILKAIRRRRIIRRKRAADVILQVLKSTMMLSQINRAIRKFRTRLILAQRYVRAWLGASRVQKRAAIKQFERLERAEVLAMLKAKKNVIRSEKEKQQSNAAERTHRDVFNLPSISREVFETTEPWVVVKWQQFQVPADVRTSVVEAEILRRRREHVGLLRSFDEEKQKFKVVKTQYMMFTARIHQFHSSLVDGRSAYTGRKVEDVVNEQLNMLASKSSAASAEWQAQGGLTKDQAALLLKLKRPVQPKYNSEFSDEEMLVLVRSNLTNKTSAMLQSLTAWYREHMAAEARNRRRRMGPRTGESQVSWEEGQA